MAKPNPKESAASGAVPREGALRGLMGYNVKRAYIALHSAAQGAAADFNMRIPAFSCLSVIVDNPGIAPSGVAEMLRMERSNIVVILDELETRELISRTQMKTDRRRFELKATVRGRRLHDKMATAIYEAEAKCMRDLAPEEQQMFVSLLNRIEASED